MSTKSIYSGYKGPTLLAPLRSRLRSAPGTADNKLAVPRAMEHSRAAMHNAGRVWRKQQQHVCQQTVMLQHLPLYTNTFYEVSKINYNITKSLYLQGNFTTRVPNSRPALMVSYATGTVVTPDTLEDARELDDIQ